MDIMDLLKMGASLIQNNRDDATTGLDTGSITNALGKLLGNSNGGLDLSSVMAGLAGNSGLGNIISSWLGQGENAPISTNQITDLLGSDKISEFASSLGLSEDSAKGALADALPQVIDKATPEGSSMVDDLLTQVGGSKGAMDMLGKMFG